MASITNSRARPLSIGPLSRLTRVHIETIRYYERIGLTPTPPRSSNGRRSYAPEHVERLRFIRRARELGFGIESIRTLLALSSGGSTSCAQARGIAVRHLADVRLKLVHLAQLEKILAETVRQCDAQCCGDDAPVCPVLDALAA